MVYNNLSYLKTETKMSISESSELSAILWDKLISKKYNEAVSEIRKDCYKTYLTYNSLDIVPIITKVLLEDIDEDGENCIEELLSIVAEIANVKEGLLVFLEEIEISKTNKYFHLFLKPLKVILLRQAGQNVKSGSFSWTFNTLFTFIVSRVDLPENLNLECKEILLLDCDSNVQKISNILFHMVDFYRDFYDKVISNELSWSGKSVSSHEYLSCFLMQILHNPLVYLYVIHTSETQNNSLYRRCHELVEMISKLIYNPFKFLDRITAGPKIPNVSVVNDDRESELKENSEEEEEEEESPKDYVSQLSLACYFYCIICENMYIDLMPLVYSHDYLFLKLLPLTNLLLLEKKYAAISKGVRLSNALVTNISDNSLSALSLEASDHREFPHCLIFVMTNCDQQEYRKECLEVFRSYMKKFTLKGRLSLQRNLLITVKHPGILSLVIQDIKNCVILEYKSQNSSDLTFTGNELMELLKLVCSLEEQEKTDLLEWSDQIMSALNLLLFLLLLKDNDNRLGIKDFIPICQKTFLDPLLKGIDLSRGHYKLKLNELETSKHQDAPETTFSVGGVILPSLPPEQEKQVIQSALCNFDMMQCVLARVQQLIN